MSASHKRTSARRIIDYWEPETVGLLFLIKWVGYAAQQIKAEDLILMPAFVAVIEDIIELNPKIEILINSELSARAEVKSGFTFEGFPIFAQILRTIKCPKVTSQPQIFH